MTETAPPKKPALDGAGQLEALEQLHRFVIRLEGAAVAARTLEAVEVSEALDRAGDAVEALLTRASEVLAQPSGKGA